MTKKINLRKSLMAARAAIHPEIRAQWDADIGAQILAWWHAHPVSRMGVYLPIQCEPDLQGLYRELAARGVQLALPVVVEKDAPLEFCAWQPGDQLTKDLCGVHVPAQRGAGVTPECLLLPCVGFNAERYRLGYGAGYYDRTLAVMPRPFTMGIAYSCSHAAFDAAAHDIALDRIITEKPV
ncbi:MAG: 5-formyltetrahydrofolate cyclo-ligase [Herminiimonas sp.]|jgi:5-formyltetrahydrofolate cyclo-ligase|nr:5-formyltetrahydrofolate cyclo-ligase [Herminiimonas sp.]